MYVNNNLYVIIGTQGTSRGGHYKCNGALYLYDLRVHVPKLNYFSNYCPILILIIIFSRQLFNITHFH